MPWKINVQEMDLFRVQKMEKGNIHSQIGFSTLEVTNNEEGGQVTEKEEYPHLFWE